jgi:hypothetical protein
VDFHLQDCERINLFSSHVICDHLLQQPWENNTKDRNRFLVMILFYMLTTDGYEVGQYFILFYFTGYAGFLIQFSLKYSFAELGFTDMQPTCWRPSSTLGSSSVAMPHLLLLDGSGQPCVSLA